ncbi:MAG: nitrogenase component I subunit alpha [Pseudodesulfovibrio sp.]|uniref:Nitrogenase protein alpha chain n=1 Tax=Pseudodesulfovibrio aespoeensis (strain ATCC 700646 / DSM 10631 / Aspo-2) TaxID=643562 RepID=E6VSQ5_PSEA9|nr:MULTISPECIES: nitrogenase component I subunit alpha [Pseudodesulfovibrio]MBU4244685.1 nitrogenase component I subunit alpha [Pseudomonadota bacterium]ADU62040.1 nitrogenase molybdenum-iron protein alpha chain [Pseudodesulfovibrio aespoeensis Aspo-2]MBU4474683.1 nitrogenase component I subunit alpha [Pseudomonadota bacterium]MBU4515990.1 nitrogenase component I subunit alpha [Pseudomonadota bacterium]MBU4522808.1 nitrogenase component I subunit alpha [Pseudomonadota bacterium]
MAKTKKAVQFNPADIKEELLKKYPPKVARKRATQIMINEAQESETPSEIVANVRTIPGIITMRGCTYAGCKGVIMGPTRDILNITHGPIGCGFYSWLTRRNQTDAGETGENYMPYCFSTDMQDQDIIFGGEKKLAAAIEEAYDLFHPKGICVFATCPVGLIGDDIHAVARKMKAKFGDCNVFAFSCEGYKGVSQSAGHHIANNQVFTHLVGENQTPPAGEYKINLLGEYNIGGDGFEIDRVLKKCGITNIATFSGNSSYEQFASAQHADLSAVMCHRSINYVADMLETKYGIPWIKVNFIGAGATAKSLRKIGQYFGDKALVDRIEAVIAEELPVVEAVAADVKTRTTGKTAMLFVGGSRAHHYNELFQEMGMKTLSAGYEFGHRDDYEGREVIPSLTVDADSRNIEEIEVEADEKLYRARKTPEEIKALEDAGYKFKHYDGLNRDMDKGSIIIDDLNQYEAEKLVELLKPDIFCAGIKEKFSIQKLGVPMKQLHSYDSGGPYAGFKGAVNFYKEIDRLVSSKVWSYMKAPWQQNPELTATFVWE